MNIKLGEATIELDRIELHLALDAVPSLSLYLKEEHAAQINKQIVESTEIGTLEWQDDSLDFKPFGYRETPDPRQSHEAVIYALLIEDALQEWFETRPEAPSRLDYGIYQNRSEVGGWTFLYNSLGRKLHDPVPSYRDRIDGVLPISTCLTRPIRQDNQQYLMTAIGYLQHHLPELVGWSAILGDAAPLRFIFFDEDNAIDLDASWENQSELLPTRYVHPRQQQRATLTKSGLVMNSGMKMALLKELAQHGLPEPLSGFLMEGSEAELLYLPGPVKLEDRLYLCERITYGFEDPEHSLFMTIELSSGFRTPASSAIPTRLEGLFKAWDEGDADEVRVFLRPPDDGSWLLMDPGDSDVLDPGADLMAKFVTPTTPNDSYAGLYVRHEADDRVVFKTQIFQTPLILGSFQILHEELEAANFSLNGELLAFSTSSSDTNINDMHGIVANADIIMSRAESSIAAEATTITQANNVQIKEDKLTIASETDIAKNTKVDKIKVTGIPGYAKPADPNLTYPIDVIKMTVAGAPAQASPLPPGAFSAPAQALALIAANASGAPFCEECEKARQAAADAATVPVEATEKTWIEIQLVGEDGKPVQGETYRITLPDGQVREGTLDDQGYVREEGIDPGNCQITFPNLDKDAWERA